MRSVSLGWVVGRAIFGGGLLAAQPGVQLLAVAAAAFVEDGQPAVARRRSGANSQMPSGSATTIANSSATTSGKSRTPSSSSSRRRSPRSATTTSSSRAAAYATTSRTRRDPGTLRQTRPEPTDGAYIQIKEVLRGLSAPDVVWPRLVYAGWRLVRAQRHRPKTRVIGPDDDPEFLRRLGHGDNNPR